MKDRLKQNKTLLGIILLGITALFLPIIILVSKDITNLNSRASLPNNLETEQGVLSSSSVTKQNDSNASGGKYVLFDSLLNPTPTPSQGSWGPRPAPSTPTGANVYTIPSSIDGSGNTDVSTALQNFVNTVPDGTNSNPSIIVFPSGNTYKMGNRIMLQDRNYVTLWGYGNTMVLTGEGQYHDSGAIRLARADNIKIFGFRVIGNDADTTDLSDGQFQMGVSMVDDSDNVEVADMHISKVHGDGIFMFTFAKPACNDWYFHHNLIEDPGRQGITPNEGNGRIEYNIIRGPGMYNIDAEDQNSSYPSNGGNKNLGPVVISNNWFDGWEQFNNYTPHVVVADYDNDAMETLHDFTIENNLFTGGDLGVRSQYWGNSNGLISFWGTVPKTNFIIRNNTFDLPSDQRTGWAIRLNNVNGGQVSGNEIPGMTVQCSSCTNVSISNNN